MRQPLWNVAQNYHIVPKKKLCWCRRPRRRTVHLRKSLFKFLASSALIGSKNFTFTFDNQMNGIENDKLEDGIFIWNKNQTHHNFLQSSLCDMLSSLNSSVAEINVCVRFWNHLKSFFATTKKANYLPNFD